MSDLISRDEAIKEIKKYAEIYANRQATDSSQYYVGKEDGCYSAIYILEVMKPAEPKDTQGHSMKKEMEALIGDIKPREIAGHIETDTLKDWCKILRHEMLCTLDKIGSDISLLPNSELLVDTKYANKAKSVRLMDREGFTRVFEEPKTGEWVKITFNDTFEAVECSACSVVDYFNKGWKMYKYCPNCGAKMERSKE